MMSISDCFRMKASSTLQKRASSLQRLTRLLCAFEVRRPLRMSEEDLYKALCRLRAEGGGATSAQHMLEALFFLDGPAKLTAINIHTVVSGRRRGVARDLYLTKNPLSQNHPLSVELVRILEESMHHEPPHAQCIVGQLLFCIHSCCRWKDAQRVRSITVERSEGESLLHADAISSKTSLSLDAKTRFLPYVALSHGILGTDWASHTVDSCKRPAGLIFR